MPPRPNKCERKIILHAGLPKTATSTIQNAFWTSRDQLMETDSLLYPEIEANHSTLIGTLFANAPSGLPRHRMGARRGAVDIGQIKEELQKKLDRSFLREDWRTALISAERISNASKDELIRLRDWSRTYGDNISVYLCVREPTSWAKSMIQQSLKSGSYLDKQYGNPILPNFRGKIESLVSVFGKDNVHVFDFETAAKSKNGPAAYFARQISLSVEGIDVIISNSAYVNESLSQEAALMLDHINRVRPLFENSSSPRSGFELSYLRNIKGRRFSIPKEVTERIYKETREDINWLNATFGKNLYTDSLENEIVDHDTIRPDTAASTALVISDLLNIVEAFRATITALEAHREGDKERSKQELMWALKLAPHLALVRRQAKVVRVPLPRKSEDAKS